MPDSEPRSPRYLDRRPFGRSSPAPRKGARLDEHLSDDALLELYLAEQIGDPTDRPDDASAVHLHACPACATRFADTANWLADTQSDGRELAEAAFTEGFFARQRGEVMRQLERLSHGARVIAFPAAARSTSMPRRIARRWISAAAVAGLILGVTAGRLLEFPPARTARQLERLERTARANTSMSAAQGSLGPASMTIEADEELMLEIDDALNTTRVRELQAIDALTPHISAVAVNLR